MLVNVGSRHVDFARRARAFKLAKLSLQEHQQPKKSLTGKPTAHHARVGVPRQTAPRSADADDTDLAEKFAHQRRTAARTSIPATGCFNVGLSV
jgi:hypothetical protein